MERMVLFGSGGGPRKILAVGAHADDIEIGCGASILRMLGERCDLEVTWLVLCASGERAREAEASAEEFLRGAARSRVVLKTFRDGYLPYLGGVVKDAFEELKGELSPDLVLTHYREDRHQDHRVISDLTWNTFRKHLILEYEIPKYDGDLGSPNVFSCVTERMLEEKIEIVLRHFRTQGEKHWLNRDVLRGLARLRGMECVAPEGFAEAFYGRKVVF